MLVIPHRQEDRRCCAGELEDALSPAEKAETVDLTLPAKSALELELPQSQGSHVNGVDV